ncbi:hypothetical protein E2C01_018324 [Portunus trituberculatus]|uniref:Uncharacterized protein n=1 Tax=Portunus trituberculatus TaxID=210409 RepID=A0A5B7DVT8_PORTR|nr:hypothetical protein [Portunus trituberculatus]
MGIPGGSVVIAYSFIHPRVCVSACVRILSSHRSFTSSSSRHYGKYTYSAHRFAGHRWSSSSKHEYKVTFPRR